MADYGFRISESGKDVKTCADVDCVITSKQPLLKGSMVGTVSGSDDDNGTEYWKIVLTINHNLGFIPVVRVFNAYDGGAEYIELPNTEWQAGVYVYDAYYEITTTQLIITVDLWVSGGDPGYTLSETFKYFISNEKVNI